MIVLFSPRRPRGVTVVEVAAAAPVAFLMIIGLMVGGLGIFRCQQVASLARVGAAYASVRGPYYQRRTGKPIATTDEVMNSAILPSAVGLDPSALQCNVTFDTAASTVTVQLTYDWLPEGLLPATKLSSVSVRPIEQ